MSWNSRSSSDRRLIFIGSVKKNEKVLKERKQRKAETKAGVLLGNSNEFNEEDFKETIKVSELLYDVEMGKRKEKGDYGMQEVFGELQNINLNQGERAK